MEKGHFIEQTEQSTASEKRGLHNGSTASWGKHNTKAGHEKTERSQAESHDSIGHGGAHVMKGRENTAAQFALTSAGEGNGGVVHTGALGLLRRTQAVRETESET